MPKQITILLTALAVFLSLVLVQATPTKPLSQSKPAPVPRFEDYAVSGVSEHGSQASIDRARDITSDVQYRKKAIEAANGRSNFAGHFALVSSSCGFVCVNFLVVNVKTNKVYYPPFGAITDSCGGVPIDLSIEYRLNSRLLIISGGFENEKKEGCWSRYYLWKGDRFVLLQQLPQKPKSSK